MGTASPEWLASHPIPEPPMARILGLFYITLAQIEVTQVDLLRSSPIAAMGRLKRALINSLSNIGVDMPAGQASSPHNEPRFIPHSPSSRTGAWRPPRATERTSSDSVPNGPVTTQERSYCLSSMHAGVLLCKSFLSTSLSGGVECQILTPIWLNARELVRPGQCGPSNKVSARQIGFVSSGARHLGRKLDGIGPPELPRGVLGVEASARGQINRIRCGLSSVGAYPASATQGLY